MVVRSIPTDLNVDSGFNPPLQARSRESLEKVLEAAECILAEGGAEHLTMAAVAERSGTSVGAIYRRFASKEKLLAAVKDRLLCVLESEVAEGLARSGGAGDLGETITAFTHSLAYAFEMHIHVIPELVAENEEMGQRGLQTNAILQRLFLDALAPHFGEIRRPEPLTAAVFSVRTVISACIHRALLLDGLPDGISWQSWSEQMSEMARAYLTNTP